MDCFSDVAQAIREAKAGTRRIGTLVNILAACLGMLWFGRWQPSSSCRPRRRCPCLPLFRRRRHRPHTKGARCRIVTTTAGRARMLLWRGHGCGHLQVCCRRGPHECECACVQVVQLGAGRGRFRPCEVKTTIALSRRAGIYCASPSGCPSRPATSFVFLLSHTSPLMTRAVPGRDYRGPILGEDGNSTGCP